MSLRAHRREGRLLAVGETMAMFAPDRPQRLADAGLFRLDAGGAESNVAAHVAASGREAAWFSRLGDDPLGRRILRQLAERRVDVTAVDLDVDHPTGLYVKDPGGGVHYYRSGSAASHLAPADAARVALDGVAALHVSGVTAAISLSARRFLIRLVERARDVGVLVSFDVNHRPGLWDARTAAPVLLDAARLADIVFVGRDEAEMLWGTDTPAAVRATIGPGPELVVKDGAIGATAFTDDGEQFQPSMSVDVIELVGAGDAFAGGYLSALLDGASVGERLAAGHARAAVTIRTTGDSVDAPPRMPGASTTDPRPCSLTPQGENTR